MALLSDYYAPRIRVPQMFQRGKTQTTELAIYRNGGIVTPTNATYQLLDEDGSDIISTTTAVISSSKCQFTINASTFPDTMSLSDGLFELWEVEIEGVDYTFQRPAFLCIRPLYPVISDIDLESSYSDLANLLPSSYTDGWQRYIDEAYIRIIERLRSLGNLPYLITDPQALRASHLELALALIWRNMHSSLGQSNGRYLDLYNLHIKSYEYSFKQCSFRYDLSEQGRAEEVDKRRAAFPMITTSNPPKRFHNLKYRRY